MASYAYDHQNRRYKTTVGSIVTHYVWQREKVLAEHNAYTGTVIVNYIYAGTRMILSGGYYLLNDQLSVRLLMNNTGAVKGQQGHLPFGEDFAESGTQQQKQHFTSYERDSQSGTDYAMNRTYSFGVGRFQSADPFQSSGDNAAPQGWNRYAYVMNAPVDFIDPMGLNQFLPGPGDICSGGDTSGDDWLDPGYYFPGSLRINRGCDVSKVRVIGEFGSDFETPEVDRWLDVDFVLTPKGIVKIPDFCSCTMSEVDYNITCTCVRLGARTDPRIQTEQDLVKAYGSIARHLQKKFPWLGVQGGYTWHHDGNDIIWFEPPNLPGTVSPPFPVPVKYISLS